MFSKKFALATAERAIKTFAQSLLALFVTGMNILSIDWTQALAVSGTAALLSVLTSIGSGNIGNDGPSLTTEVLDSKRQGVQ
jgi:hypothetical protein